MSQPHPETAAPRPTFRGPSTIGRGRAQGAKVKDRYHNTTRRPEATNAFLHSITKSNQSVHAYNLRASLYIRTYHAARYKYRLAQETQNTKQISPERIDHISTRYGISKNEFSCLSISGDERARKRIRITKRTINRRASRKESDNYLNTEPLYV